jgi:hypothetical protein
VPCGLLTIQGDDFGEAKVETGQDEQIADNCEVRVLNRGVVRIGNNIGRTETIGSLTLDGSELTMAGLDDSLLILTGNLTRRGADEITHVYCPLRFTAPVTELICNGPGALSLNKPLTRSGSAGLRLTGGGNVFVQASAAVPFTVVDGSLTFYFYSFGDASASPVVLDSLPGTAETARLQGTGRCGNVTAAAGGGVITSGILESLGILTTGNLSLNAASRLVTQIHNAAGTGHDQISVIGGLAVNNAALDLLYLPGFSVAFGTSIVLVDNDGGDAIIGTFAGLPQGAFIPVPAENGSGGWIISYTGGTGNDVSLTRVAQAPPGEVPAAITGVNFGAADVNGNRPVNLTATGVPGASYRLENSVNLLQWTPEGTAQTAAAGTGALNFSSTASPLVRLKQFWRLRRQ